MRFCFSLGNVKKDNVIISQGGARGVDMKELGQKKRKILGKAELTKRGGRGNTTWRKQGKEGIGKVKPRASADVHLLKGERHAKITFLLKSEHN